jgi:hypothetical protein
MLSFEQYLLIALVIIAMLTFSFGVLLVNP